MSDAKVENLLQNLTILSEMGRLPRNTKYSSSKNPSSKPHTKARKAKRKIKQASQRRNRK